MDNKTKHYSKLIKQYILNNYQKHFQKPVEGIINYPYFTSGIDYTSQVWDWGSWLNSLSLRSINSKELEECQKGVILNFLERMDSNGKMPILFSSKEVPWLKENSNAFKPCLSIHVLEISNKYNDFSWIKPHYEKLKRFIDYYDKYQKDIESGLYFWIDDFAIGFDNDPTVFYHPNNSVAAIYLNSLMYVELVSLSEIAKSLGYNDDYKKYLKKADELKNAINNECFDEIDGFYYSADISLRKIDPNEWLHSGHPRIYKTLPIKITTWAGMLPLWAKIASQEQADRCIKRYLNPEGLYSKYGIRSTAKNEKMYSEIASSNPSCWLGPIWINANYFTYIGLKRYGYKDLANEIAEKTINMLGKDLETNGGFHEYYNSNTGEGIRGLGMHGWNFLVLELINDLENNE